MNAETQTFPSPDVPTLDFRPETLDSSRHRNGKIARLPKEARERINKMLDDGLTYAAIIRELGDHAKGLTTAHIGSWKKGGYQDYLHEERRRDECRLRHDFLAKFASEQPGIESYQAAPKIAVALASEALVALGPETLRRALQENPLNAFRLLNAMARVLSGGLKCERHLADQVQRQARLHDENQPEQKKGLSPGATSQMIDALNLM